MVTLKLYGDESADETKSRVFAVAGVTGTEDEWALAMREWLRRTRGKEFHANKCEFEFVRDPDPQKHKDNQKLYEDLTKILASSHLVGFAVALDLASHRELMPDSVPEMPYYKCFSDVLVHVARTAGRFNAMRPDEEPVGFEFMFDSRKRSDGTAGQVFQMIRQSPEFRAREMFGPEVQFDGGPDPRLEAADLFAREAMKELDRKVTQARPKPRGSYVALNKTEKFKFIELDRAYCVEWRRRLEQPESRQMWDQYENWLADTKRVQHGVPRDTMMNRSLFYMWLERQEALASTAGVTPAV